MTSLSVNAVRGPKKRKYTLCADRFAKKARCAAASSGRMGRTCTVPPSMRTASIAHATGYPDGTSSLKGSCNSERDRHAYRGAASHRRLDRESPTDGISAFGEVAHAEPARRCVAVEATTVVVDLDDGGRS